MPRDGHDASGEPLALAMARSGGIESSNEERRRGATSGCGDTIEESWAPMSGWFSAARPQHSVDAPAVWTS